MADDDEVQRVVERAYVPRSVNGGVQVEVTHDLDPFALLKATARALADKVMRWVVLLMSFALFAYAAIKHEPWSFAGATTFTVLALALLWRGKK